MDHVRDPDHLLRLELRRERLHAVFADPDGERAVAVRPLWARPVSGVGGEVSLVDDAKREVLLIERLDALDAESRAALEAALDDRSLVPRVTRVVECRAHLGVRYWTVETDRGPHRFAMREPTRNVVWLDERRAVLRDVLGNRYRIDDFAALDQRSREQARKVL